MWLTYYIKDLRKDNKWLTLSQSSSLWMSLKNLWVSFKWFFNKWWYPKYKNRYSKQSVSYRENIHIKENKIKIPKIWRVRFSNSRECIGNIKTMTITKNASGKYFVSITTDYIQWKPSWIWLVGIDVGIKSLAVTSDGDVIENPKFLKKTLRKLSTIQRRLSRKQKWSNNRKKAKLTLAIQHEKIANQRKDYLHKASTSLSKRYKVACMEKLNTKGMLKNHCLAQAISDSWWYMLKTMLQYKMEVQEIWRFEPSSKMCNNCWNIKKDLSLADRTYKCDICGYEADRDLNAAKNILKICTVGNTGTRTPVDSDSIETGRSRKANK